MERVPTETQRGISQLQLADGTAAGSESLTDELFEKILGDPHLEKIMVRYTRPLIDFNEVKNKYGGSDTQRRERMLLVGAKRIKRIVFARLETV